MKRNDIRRKVANKENPFTFRSPKVNVDPIEQIWSYILDDFVYIKLRLCYQLN